MSNFFGAARDAVWHSIREYKPLAGDGVEGSLFRAVYLWNKKQAEIRYDLALPPPVELMDAISIRTGPGGSDAWETHTNKLVEQFIEITTWSRSHDQEHAEQLWQWIWESIQQVPSTMRPYIMAAIGVRPIQVRFPTITFTKTQFEERVLDTGLVEQTSGNPCTMMQFSIVADHRKDPRSAAN